MAQIYEKYINQAVYLLFFIVIGLVIICKIYNFKYVPIAALTTH